MKNIYSFVGGRKMFVFYLILCINAVAVFYDKYTSEFGNFCVMLGSMYVLGNVGSKFSGTDK